MKFRTLGARTSLVVWLLLVLFIPRILFAQNPLGSVSGQISDPSGAAVPTASVSAASIFEFPIANLPRYARRFQRNCGHSLTVPVDSVFHRAWALCSMCADDQAAAPNASS